MMEVATPEAMILETLQQAGSQDTAVLKPAEQRLKEWEVQPGFYSVLLKIIADHSIDVTARWQAVLYFKNGVDRYWRKSATNAIKEDEKATLRVELMGTLREPVNQVATQLAVLIARAARYDCPREWPELIPQLLQVVQSEDLVLQHRGLLTLLHVIKALASKRLAGDRRQFQDLTASLYAFVINMWNSHYDLFFRQVQANDSQCQATLDKALLSLRILRKLTVHGFKAPHESQDVVLFISVVFDRAKTMLHCRKSMEEKSTGLMEGCGKIAVTLVTVLLGVLENYPFSFVPFIPTTLQAAVDLTISPEHQPFLFERFGIHCFNLVKGILVCAEFTMTKADVAVRNPATVEAHRLKEEFFTPEVLNLLCTKLITHYFLLTREDLETWDADPEDFGTDDIGNMWRFNVHPCTEALFMTLFRKFRDSLCPVVLDLIQQNHQMVNPDDMPGILLKDAVYNAVGLAAFDLYDKVDFDQWFSSTLVLELKVKGSNYRVIRRRVAWLIGRWTGVKMSPDLRPALYEALMPLLQGDEDMAVRLTAANALKYAVDDFEFNAEQFLDFLPPVFSLLFTLLQEAKECDTKMQVLYVLSFIVERMGAAIRPHSTALACYLPELWKESGDHNMLRCAIVSTLVQFVRALVTENLTSFLYTVVELSCDVQQDMHVYLLEDGLELWFAVLESTTTLTPELLNMFNAMPPVLDFTCEYLHCCCQIIQAYVLLSPQEFLSAYGQPLVASLMDLLVDMNNEGVQAILDTMTVAIKACPTLAVQQATPMINFALLRVHNGEDLPIVMTSLLSILSRVVLHSTDCFYQLVEAVAATRSGETTTSFSLRLAIVWMTSMPLVSSKEDKKLLALALSTLLTYRPLQAAVLFHVSAFMKSMIETLHDVADMDSLEPNQQMCFTDTVMVAHTQEDNETDADPETEHDRRRRHMLEADPVFNVTLQPYLQTQLNLLRSQIGTDQYDDRMRSVDSCVVEQARQFLEL